MNHNKILIIEDNKSIQQQLTTYYDKQCIHYELCNDFLSAREKIHTILTKGQLGKYNYILMDGELNNTHTDELIKTLLAEDDVPPIISISGAITQSEQYNLPYADKLGILNNLKYILGQDYKEDTLSDTIQDHEKFKSRFDTRAHNITARKELITTLTQSIETITPDIPTSHTTPSPQSFFQKLLAIFSKKQS